jgi:hypothetical protein
MNRLARFVALHVGMWIQDRGGDLYLWAGRK